MSIANIQTGDKVKVIAGKFKNTVGVVTKVHKLKSSSKVSQPRATVSSVPTIADYRKKNAQFSMPGEQREKPRTINVSNLALVMDDGNISKTKIVVDDKGVKQRVYKKTNKTVVKQKIEKTKVSENE
jgi:ribosomal protein L24